MKKNIKVKYLIKKHKNLINILNEQNINYDNQRINFLYFIDKEFSN